MKCTGFVKCRDCCLVRFCFLERLGRSCKRLAGFFELLGGVVFHPLANFAGRVVGERPIGNCDQDYTACDQAVALSN